MRNTRKIHTERLVQNPLRRFLFGVLKTQNSAQFAAGFVPDMFWHSLSLCFIVFCFLKAQNSAQFAAVIWFSVSCSACFIACSCDVRTENSAQFAAGSVSWLMSQLA